MEDLAGTGMKAHDDGPSDNASFSFPNGIAVGRDHRNLYVNEYASTALVDPFAFELKPNFILAISLSPLSCRPSARRPSDTAPTRPGSHRRQTQSHRQTDEAIRLRPELEVSETPASADMSGGYSASLVW
jgi:hypothetical protein